MNARHIFVASLLAVAILHSQDPIRDLTPPGGSASGIPGTAVPFGGLAGFAARHSCDPPAALHGMPKLRDPDAPLAGR